MEMPVCQLPLEMRFQLVIFRGRPENAGTKENAVAVVTNGRGHRENGLPRTQG